MSPADGSPVWVVVDRQYLLHEDASDFLASLRGQEDASVNTERTYAGRVALYLSYCEEHGIAWGAPTMRQLGAFLNWLAAEPLPGKGRRPSAEPRHRSKSTANAILTTVCQFLRFCSLMGRVSPDLVALLSQPKQLRFLPRGYDVGEEGQFATLNVKTIRFKVSVPGFEYLTDGEISRLLDCTTRARDRFLIVLLAVTGIRIGEALGLRREDMHLLANSMSLGCRVAGPHVHIRRRQNANGALAKARQPRWVPVDEEVARFYADYQWERDTVAEAADCDMVFVNLFKQPLGDPMKYPSTYELFTRLAKKAGFPARPHMLRHSAATRWVREGRPRHVIQDLMGHVSPQSMEPYLHASDQEKREAVRLVSKIRERRR
ncbi:tyrosine-type recombinase/integrase (plasmid) [Embleya sp. NBC_00888]|uniref:tyrosine-type recombinase/integrase n=1 Tax=Embleya sp. NBC_00888 TaxID=2975960 RepID=UPI00387046BC|nr:tyrosine-type recombinase/integrase [Embleya sp. NBC_00888]